jgi:hypothetical protein
MRDIVKPITPDGLCGYDANGKLWLYEARGDGAFTGSMIQDPRGQKCPICLQGWVLTSGSMKDQTQWRVGGSLEFVHQTCSIRYNGLVERDMWFDALCDAGIRFRGIANIENRYWSEPPWSSRPWYRVSLMNGRTLRLGYRKRVYSLEIEPGGDRPYDVAKARELFTNEDVTKEINDEGLLIHAYGDIKAREYIKVFAQILPAPTPAEQVNA